MTPCYQSCLAPKILSELHVEDHVALDTIPTKNGRELVEK